MVVRADSEKEEGGKLDKILSHLDSVKSEMDAAKEERRADRARLDALCGRMDAADEKEKERKDAEEKARKDGEEAMADKAKKDAEEKTRKDAEVVAAAATEKTRKDAEIAEQARKDAEAAARHDADPALAARLAAMEKRIPTELTEEARQSFVESQSRAERVAQAFGDSAGAPRWLNGETRDQYRRRLLGKYKEHSPQWKDVELMVFADKALDTVEAQVYADAMAAAVSPSRIPAGTLHARTERDQTGRQFTKFYGDTEACWGPFKLESRIVSGYKRDHVRH